MDGSLLVAWASPYVMVRKQLEGLSPETQHGVMAGGALSFYAMS